MDILLLTMGLIPPFLFGLWVRRLIERPGVEDDRRRFDELYQGSTAADRAERDELAWRLGALPYGVHQWKTDDQGNVVWNHDVDIQWRKHS